MSDGDHAGPGRRRSDDHGDGHWNAHGDDNQWLTRTPRPTPGAAPWERHQPAGDVDDPEPTGSHASGVTVADLIAKLSGRGSADKPRRRHHADEPEPEHEPEPASAPPSAPRRAVAEPSPPTEVLPPVDNRADEPDTEVIPVVAPPTEELPLLVMERRVGRVPPSRVDGVTDIAEPEPEHRRRGVVVAGRAAAALAAVLALLLTGGAWQWQTVKNNSLNKVSALDQSSRDIVDPNAQFGDENFLIVGVDTRLGANSTLGAGGTDDAAGTRSDTIMLVNIPASRERVVAVSFPRDLAITPIQCEPWDPQTGTYGPIWDETTQSYGPEQVYTETKLNSAYAYGGPKCLVTAIQKLSGLSINRFMAVDFSGFAKMVDAVGGVEVCTTTPLIDTQLGTVLPTAGRQTIDGATALEYVRARHVTTEITGDYARIERQQRFLSSLMRSLISREVFFSLSKLNNVVDTFIDDTSVDNVGTKELVQLGQSIQGVAAGRITFLTIPTGETNANGDEPPRTKDMRAMFEAIINDEPLPGEKNADNTPVPGTPESTSAAPESTSPEAAAGEVVNAVTTDPHGVTVRVSNSTSQSGLAANAATALEQYGFNVKTPDDYPTSLSATTVRFSPGNEEAAATVASSFANPNIERVTGLGKTVRVVLGSDFNSVAPPSPNGSEMQVQVEHGTNSTPTELPEDLTITNAADTSCE